MHFVLASAALSKLALSFDNLIQLVSVGFSCGPSAMSEVLSQTIWVRLSYETREVDLDLDYCT